MSYIILFYFTIVLLSGYYKIIYLLIDNMLNSVYLISCLFHLLQTYKSTIMVEEKNELYLMDSRKIKIMDIFEAVWQLLSYNGKFKKKGTKLHIYMDHVFVARHIKLGSSCHVCSIVKPLRLGKQAYVCHDCGLVCHKPCHVRVQIHCANTSLPNMELEFYPANAQA